MKKENLIKLIEKSTLNATEFPIIIENGEVHNLIDVKSVIRSTVSVEGTTLDNLDTVPVSNPKTMLGLLKAFDSEISVAPTFHGQKSTSLVFSDESMDATYVLGDISVIPNIKNTRPIKDIPSWNIDIPLYKETIERFNKAKSAVGAENFAVSTVQSDIQFTVNYVADRNVNKVNFSIVSDENEPVPLPEPVIFNANALSTVFSVNKDFVEARLKVYYHEESGAGLLVIQFTGDGWTADYRIPSLMK
jgi:hypothetical protein